MPYDHTLKRYDEELKDTNQRLVDMSSAVESQIVNAVQAFVTGNVEGAEQIIKDDKRINKMEVQIDKRVVQIIATRQPIATDLRFLITVSKSLVDLERVGDEAKKIAKSAQMVSPEYRSILPLDNIQKLCESTVDMLKRAIEAFSRRDAALAVEICYADLGVNDQFKVIMDQIRHIMTSQPEALPAALEAMYVSKSLERLGDHAKNIAQYAIYQVFGKVVRHFAAEKIRRRVAKYGGEKYAEILQKVDKTFNQQGDSSYDAPEA